MKIVLMGTGTSFGVPVIGCKCKVCLSECAEDKRMRCSAFICDENTSVVIDTGPEFRVQSLKFGVSHLDGVLLTHSHADHVHGLDDVRVFSHTRPAVVQIGSTGAQTNFPLETAGAGLPIYANKSTVSDLRLRFEYVFHPRFLGGGLPKLNLLECESFSSKNPLKIGTLSIVPIPMIHGKMSSTGWLIKGREGEAIAYLTDCNEIPDESIEEIKRTNWKIRHLVIDGLRVETHPTHFSFNEALAYAEKIGATHTWITHVSHDLSHVQIQAYLDKRVPHFPNLSKIVSNGGSVSPAFDGLILNAQ